MKFKIKPSRDNIILAALVLIAVIALFMTCFKITRHGSATVDSQEVGESLGHDSAYSLDSILSSSLFEGYTPITADEFQQNYGLALATPEYIPSRFKLYESVFVQSTPSDSDSPYVTRLWYDPNTLDSLYIYQRFPGSVSGSDGEFYFSDSDESGNPMINSFPWAAYRSAYEIDTAYTSIQGYMLVNDASLEKECKRILTSIKID